MTTKTAVIFSHVMYMNCNSKHCFMMNYAIDVLLHGQKLRVIKVFVLTANLSYMGYGYKDDRFAGLTL